MSTFDSPFEAPGATPARCRCGFRVVACLAVAASLAALAISTACPSPETRRAGGPALVTAAR